MPRVNVDAIDAAVMDNAVIAVLSALFPFLPLSVRREAARAARDVAERSQVLQATRRTAPVADTAHDETCAELAREGAQWHATVLDTARILGTSARLDGLDRDVIVDALQALQTDRLRAVGLTSDALGKRLLEQRLRDRNRAYGQASATIRDLRAQLARNHASCHESDAVQRAENKRLRGELEVLRAKLLPVWRTNPATGVMHLVRPDRRDAICTEPSFAWRDAVEGNARHSVCVAMARDHA